jgi:hypothetical protein
VKRREAATPDTPEISPGTRDGQAQITDDRVTQSDPCGHLHESPEEAGRCAENLAARLNSKPMPPEYYWADPGKAHT